MEIAVGMVGMGLTFLGIILAYIWRANGRYLRELQREIGLVAQGLMEGQNRIMEGLERLMAGQERLMQGQERLMEGQERMMNGQERIAKSVEEVAKIAAEVLKEVRVGR